SGPGAPAAARQARQSPTPVAELVERIDAAVRGAGGRPVRAPASFVVADRRVTLSVDLRAERIVAHNVLGMVEGADPALRHELVVVGAHFDHDGIDEAGRIYNGADDDGSGTAAVLEIAEAFAEAARGGARPRRTVVFALWNAEEKGLLGSRHYAARPAPPGRVVANVNLDMVGRNEHVPDERDPRFRGLTRTTPEENADAVHLIGYSYSPDLAAIVREENAAVGLKVRTTLDDNPQNLIRRSDHWVFLQRRIPAAMFTTGLHPDYHTAQDDVEKINFDKLEKIARLAYRVAWRVASGAEPPRYVEPAPARRASP
ncbi:MAG TPA: M20/M25/M40 family metallo-hydrolase, partial [Vicinamibacterales bacterium]|nr:M20/M25/M40 family metallo-hydrolase [Vicinamibacterales bacterium]